MKVCGYDATLSREELIQTREAAAAGGRHPTPPPGSLKLVTIPKPSPEVVEQLTARVLTGRSNGSSASNSEVAEEVALGWLMDMQSPKSAAGSTSGTPVAKGALAQEMLQRLGVEPGAGQLRRPTEEEITSMAARIAQVRVLTDAQFEQVRFMLRDIAGTLFGSTPSASQQPPAAASSARPPAVPVGQGPARQPTPEELQRMAQSLGPDPSFRRLLASGIPRPSPRTLEAITQRVIARTGGAAQEGAVRQMLAELTQAFFEPGQSAVTAEQSSEHVPSQLCTARSSVRSRSSASQEHSWPRSQATAAAAPQPEVQQEVHGLMTELCGVLFEAESP